MRLASSPIKRSLIALGALAALITACSSATNPVPVTVPTVDNTPTAGVPGVTAPPAVTRPAPNTPPLIPTVAPTITATADGRWDAAVTWGGKLPVAGDVVSIPRGRSVELTGSTAKLEGLWVDGTLRFGDADLELSSRYVVVSGALLAGTPSVPYTKQARVTLFGTDQTQNVLGMGTKFIGVANGGALELYGELRLAWTQLTSNADIGATSLTLKDSASTWRTGDKIVVAPGGFDPREAEVVTVRGVSGSNVTFAPALKYARVAHMETVEGKLLDERPSVGLLSRNIVVRGADDSDANAFGGHIMVMAGGSARASGVELTKMGQRGRFGRYPLHWHLAGDRRGDYLMGSAIHDSFQRAAVVHSTSNVLIDGNVAYNISNHAFVWAEDGDEAGVVMTRNLAMLVRSPEEKDFAFPIQNPFFANSSQAEQRSAAFWGRSFKRHVIRGNVSAGVLNGSGFFLDLFSPAAKLGGDEGGGLIFEGNTAHATYKERAIGNQINYPEATQGHGLMVTTGTSGKYQHVLSGYTGFHNTNGAWLEDRSVTLKNSIVADNGLGVIVHRSVLDGVTVVGKSANTAPTLSVSASVTFGVTAGIDVGGSNHGGKRAPLILNATIVNQDGAGILWDLDNISPASLLGNVRFVNTPRRLLIHPPGKFEFPDSPTFALNDPLGKVVGDGRAVRWMTSDAPTITADCTEVAEAQAFACPAASSLLLSSNKNVSLIDSTGRVAAMRSFNYADAGMPAEGTVSYVGNGERIEVLSNETSRHEFTLGEASGKTIELSFAATGPAVKVTFAGQDVGAVGSLEALRSSTASAQRFEAGRLYVRLAATSAQSQTAVIQAPFAGSTFAQTGLSAVALPSGAVTGFTSSVSRGAVTNTQQRYTIPAQSGVSATNYSANQLDWSSANPALAGSGSGDVTVLRTYVNAPVDGTYRLTLWGDGGGTAIFAGDTWVMGQPSAFINSNFVKGGQFDSEVVPFLHPNGLVALKAGWHAITIIHAKMPGNNQSNTLDLRWATPQNPNAWVYPSLRRAP